MGYRYVGDSFGNEPAIYATLADFIAGVDRLDEPEYSAAVRCIVKCSDGNYWLDNEIVLQPCIPCSLCGQDSGFYGQAKAACWYLCEQCEGSEAAHQAGFTHDK